MALINAKAMPTNHTDYSNYIKVVACLTNYMGSISCHHGQLIRAHTCTLTHMHAHSYTLTCMHTHTHAHSHARTQMHIHVHSHTHARTLTHTDEKLPYMVESIYTLNKIRHSSNWVFVHWPAFIQSGGPLANIVKHLKDPPHYQKPSAITHHSISTRSRFLRNSVCLDC